MAIVIIARALVLLAPLAATIVRDASAAPTTPSPPAPPSSQSSVDEEPLADDPTTTPDDSPMPAPAPIEEEAPRLRLFAGADGIASSGLEPLVHAGALVHGGARRGITSLALELRGDFGGADSFAGGRVRSSLFATSVVPCIHIGATFGCLLAMVGRFGTTSEGVHSARSDASWLVAIGPRVGIELSLSPTIALRAHAEALANLAPAHLILDGNDVWTAPTLAVSGGAGVVVRFR